MTADVAVKPKRTLAAYLQPKTLLMLVLGFSSGLPFLLVGNTLGYWLRDEGTSLAAIGFISWVGIAYSLKFLWAPVIDRVNAPIFSFLGRRRSWMALSQILVGLAFVAMAFVGTKNGLVTLGAFALAAAFSAATQDIVIDAWRIESAANTEELGLLSSAYQFGFRVALLATDAIILAAAEHFGWSFSYALYGALMGIGLLATFLAVEPVRADAVMEAKAHVAPIYTLRGIFDAIAGPFIAFFGTYGWIALLMLFAISFYRVPDFVMGPMVNPYYHDIGLTKDAVAAVRGSVSFIASLAGIAAGGFVALRFGYLWALIVGGVLQAAAIAAFAVLASTKADLPVFVAIMIFDSIATSFAGVALVSYMSSLTSLGYTATQYALLASSYTMLGKFLKGFSGQIVESLSAGSSLMHAYAVFFIGCGLTGIPGIALFIVLARILHNRHKPAT
ncbi:MAG TPA: MFS transporter [Rhizomicrobium sp.]|jgi:PAT family beta-lactamase induction signal transducer AmpG|nr:MFS transporter [Rhizomicrobium sp.]